MAPTRPAAPGTSRPRCRPAGSSPARPAPAATAGARIDHGDAAALTLPFRRGVRDRVGSDRGVGLGLSIVQAIADHHGGRLELTPLEPGGLAVELVLPLDRGSGGEGHAMVGPGN